MGAVIFSADDFQEQIIAGQLDQAQLLPDARRCVAIARTDEGRIRAAAVAHGADYTAYFTATLPSQKAQVGDLTLYRKGNELVLIPGTEPLPGKELMTRWSDSTYCVNFATASLPPGRYQARIVAKGPAAAWAFTVK